MKKEKIVLFELGLEINGIKYIDDDFVLPKGELPLMVNFNDSDIVGTASNFRMDCNKLLCDIESDRLEAFATIAPRFEGTTPSKGVEQLTSLTGVSVVFRHAFDHLNCNLMGTEKVWVNEEDSIKEARAKGELLFMFNVCVPTEDEPIKLGAVLSGEVVKTSNVDLVRFAFEQMRYDLILNLQKKGLWKEDKLSVPETKEVKNED